MLDEENYREKRFGRERRKALNREIKLKEIQKSCQLKK